jgi:transposase-like protein
MASERNRYLDAAEQHWLWRAVDQNGLVLEVLIQRRRDSRAARRLVKKPLKFGSTPPRVMITYKPRSYGAARAKMAFTSTIDTTKLSTTGLRILISRPGDASGS